MIPGKDCQFTEDNMPIPLSSKKPINNMTKTIILFMFG